MRFDYLLANPPFGVDWKAEKKEIDRDTLDEQDGGIGRVGYEINFNREFFQYQPPRLLAEIDAELEAVEKRIMGLLREVTE